MNNEWYNRKEESMNHYYDYCGFAHEQDFYQDCPFPLNYIR